MGCAKWINVFIQFWYVLGFPNSESIGLLQSTQRRIDQSFFGVNIKKAAHSNSAASITLMFNILLISTFFESRAFGPALYWDRHEAPFLLDISAIQGFTTVFGPWLPPEAISNYVIKLMKLLRWASHLMSIKPPICQSCAFGLVNSSPVLLWYVCDSTRNLRDQQDCLHGWVEPHAKCTSSDSWITEAQLAYLYMLIFVYRS